MKKIFSILSFLIVFSGFSQEYSNGIVVPTGFNIQASTPIDDRFVVADSLSLYDLSNKYDGMFAVTLDEEKRVLWTYNEGEDLWYRAGVTDAENTSFDDTTTQLGETNVQGAIEKIANYDKPFPFFTSIRKSSEIPLIEASESGWDINFRENGNIVWDGMQYVMCYSGYIPPYSETSAVYVGIATSPTGEPGTWTKRGINGDGQAFTFNYGEDPFLIFRNGEYIIYYENKSVLPQTIAIASTTNLDGEWTNVTDEVLGLLPGEFDDMDASSPTLFFEDDILYMFYEYRKLSTTETLDSRGTTYLAKSLDFGDTWEIVKEVVNSSNLTWSTSSVPDAVFKYGDYYYMLGHGELNMIYRSYFVFSSNLEDWTDFLQKPFDIDNESQTARGAGIMVYKSGSGIIKSVYLSDNKLYEGVFNASLMNSWIYRQRVSTEVDFSRVLAGVINANRDEFINFTQTQERPYTAIRPDDNGGAGINKIIRNDSNFNFHLKPIDGVLLDGTDDEIVLLPKEYIHILSTGKNTYTLVNRGVQNPALVAYTNDYNDLDNKPNLESIPINVFNQVNESSVSGNDGVNLLNPEYGLYILNSSDLQDGNSFLGELILHIDNQDKPTAKVVELFGAEIYNNTNPSDEVIAKVNYKLDFFNPDGDDIDYKLSWQYVASGEVLFGEHTDTIDSTESKLFELLVTGHEDDVFTLKSAYLNRVTNFEERVLSTKTFKLGSEVQNAIYNNIELGNKIPQFNTIKAIDEFISNLKTTGVWPKLDIFSLFQMNDNTLSDFALYDYKRGAFMTAYGGIGYTINGYEGNGVDGYINTNFNPAISGVNYTLNNASRGVWISKVPSSNSASVVGIDVSSNTPGEGGDNRFNVSTLTGQRINQDRSNLNTSANLVGLGLKVINRDDSTNIRLYNNSTELTRTATSTSIKNATQLLLTSDNGYGDSGLGFYFMGGSLTAQNVSDLRTAYLTYLTKIGL
jgi:hypothetical protein